MEPDIVGWHYLNRLLVAGCGQTSTTGVFVALNVMLFTNQYTLECSTDAMSVLTPLSVSGYAAKSLTWANWTYNQDKTNCIMVFSYPTVSWTFTAGGQTIYGHAVYDTVVGMFCWGKNWPTPYTIPAIGGQVQLNISITIEGCGSGSLAARSSRRVRAARLQRST